MNLTSDGLAYAVACLSLGATGILAIRQRRALRAAARLAADIQSRYEVKLQLSQMERDRLLDALLDALVLVDARGLVVYANEAARALFHVRDCVGRSVRETILDHRLAEPVLRCLATGEAARATVVLPGDRLAVPHSDGAGPVAWVVDAAPIPGERSDDALIRVLFSDITAQTRTEQVRRDFVANASHELRTPLAIISGYLENLLDDNLLESQDTARRFLTVMRKHSDRISRLVEDMLVISRMESGEASALNKEPFRIQACVADVIERLEPLIQSQGSEIRLRIADPSLSIHGDRFYWTQILFNLVENALKQNPNQGLTVEVGCERGHGLTRIWVSDNGIGIPASHLPHVFRRFYRVEHHHSQNAIKGTGLGLSIVKRAVEAHGGTIGVTSIPGTETRFVMEIPDPAPASSATTEHSSLAEAG